MERNLALLDQIERMAHIGCWEMDPASGKVSWSDEVYRIFGISPHEFSHTEEGFFKLVHPEDRPKLALSFWKAVEERQDHIIVDYRIERHDNGELRYVREIYEISYDETNQPVNYHGILQDITEQTKLEMNLRHSEAHFRQLANTLPAMICEFLPDGTLTYVNKAYCEFYEMTEDELIGRRFQDLLPEDLRETAGKRHLSLTPDSPASVNTSRIVRHEEIRWREWRDLAFFDSEGNMIKVQGLGIDITDRKRAEIALQETNQKLEEAKEMAEDAAISKSRFLDSMSHEIRTPLNGIVGMIQVMELTKLSDEQKELLEIAQTSSNILLNLINNILDYSKIKSGTSMLEKVPFDIDEIMGEVKTFFAPMIEMKGLSLHFEVDPVLPKSLAGDPLRIKQVLINLVNNALKFTNEGRIDVKVRKVGQQENKVQLKWLVEDTGTGIPEKDLENIFLSFTQAESSSSDQRSGTGLGLAICATIVEQMQGEIWAESDGKGSRFFFTCWLEESELTETQTEPSAEISRNNNRKLQLLVVDDDETSRLFIGKIGEKKGWSVTGAVSGLEAINIFQLQQFDVILMDIQMPGKDGIEIAAELRQLEQSMGVHTPIIAVTAKALPGDRERCLEAGLDDYLAKPFTTRQLIDMITGWTYAQR